MIHKHKVFTMGVTVLTVASLLAGCGSQEGPLP
jgi:membrane fusion protein (multidrug efflux system)